MDDAISRKGTSAWLENMGYSYPAKVIMDEKRFPSVLGTNLAEVGTDLISRAAAQTELQLSARRYTVAHEAHGEGRVVWSEDLISVSDAMDVLRKIPSAQPTFDARDTQYNLPIGTDAISRQQAIDAADVYMKRLCRYIGTSDDTRAYAFARGLLVGIKTDIGELPSAQPKRGKWILDRSGSYSCSECMEPCAGYVMMRPRDKFCKMCGAKMEVTE